MCIRDRTLIPWRYETVYLVVYIPVQCSTGSGQDDIKMRVSPLHQQRHCSASRVPPVPHKGLRMYSSAAEATGGAVAITGAVVVQDTPRSCVLGPAIICSRATHVPPVLPLLFPFPPGFAVAPATFYSRAKLDRYAAQIQVQPGTSNVHHIFRSARTSSFLRCRFV